MTNFMRYFCFVLAIFLLASLGCQAQTPIQDEIFIWPGPAPGTDTVSVVEQITDRDPNGGLCHLNRVVEKVTQPSIKYFAASSPNGKAVLICPGGGYAKLAYDKEGYNIAQWYNERDITAFVLKYRLPTDGHAKRKYVPLQDAQRAIRFIRANAQQYNIHPDSIGVMGGSAGGHLAASLSVFYDWQTYAPVDSADSLSARPNFSVLMYPVISFQDSIGHSGSRSNLLGSSVSQALKDSFSTELHVDSLTPPAFLFHSQADGSVKYQNSQAYARALDSAGVAYSLNLYKSGGHGVGKCEAGTSDFSRWPRDLDDWLEDQGWTGRCRGAKPVVTLSTQDTVLLIASPGTGYQWYRNGIPLNGANDSIYEPKALASYAVSVRSERAGSQSVCLLYSDPVEVSSLTNISSDFAPLLLYPNPIESLLRIGNLKLGDLQTEYFIFNPAGQQLVRGKLKARTQINVSHLSPGMYFLKIVSSKKILSGKFIKK